MKKLFYTLILLIGTTATQQAQESFDFTVELEQVNIPGLPGLHSYAFAQYDGKWLIIGGRKDGIHARQPFNAFPAAQNNSEVIVIDVNTQQFWTAPLNVLPTGISEQLQSTNMNFYQDGNDLFIIGGYAYSPTADDHITFPYLTSIDVAGLVNAVVNNNSIIPYFKHITDDIFANTGGQLGKIGTTFYLVGGQRFDGRYNPMNNPTFVQTYATAIQKFTIDNSGNQLSFDNYTATTDEVHLRRRDYNLIPQIFPDGAQGYMISSGVFQENVNLPFLYPVEITELGYTPVTGFNQYLSNYHSATAALYDSDLNEMHSIFFGGISQFYYQNGNLIQDNNVPFVKTISRVTRFAEGGLQEFVLPIEMPGLRGAGSEFIPNKTLPNYNSEIIKLNDITTDEFIIGHVYGGIFSPSLNPFTNNQTSTTSADAGIYAIKLIRNQPMSIQEINGNNPYSFKLYPNPATTSFTVEFESQIAGEAYYYISNASGQILKRDALKDLQPGNNIAVITIDEQLSSQVLSVTVVFENKFFVTKQLIKK
ncbi:hypothetical protein [uncultured Planktosalinus sp.]|uniref:hypothetical protein n=1 Tax=uncultured Planktosalinus sp. TaxID=1810935 RepID=UPI0030D77E31